MKILMINAVCGIKSTGRTVKELAEKFIDDGDDVVIAYGEDKNNTGGYNRGETYYIGNAIGHKIHALLSRMTGLQGYYSHYSTYKLLRYMKRFAPDIVQIGNIHGNYINERMLFRYLSKNSVPTVILLHDCYLFTGGCMHYSDNMCDNRKNSCRRCGYTDKRMASWFFNRAAKICRDRIKEYNGMKELCVVGVSNWITGEVKASILGKARLIECIYNSVDTSLFYPHDSDARDELGIGRERFVILGVATAWNESKGIGDYYEFSRLIGDDAIILLIGGSAKNGEKRSNIICMDYIGSVGKLSDIYAAADVLFNPSTEESFSKVTAEAISCGTPAVVYDATALPELVDGGCGYVVKKHDIAAAYEAVMKIKKNGKQFYQDACVRKANGIFDLHTNFLKRKALYHTVAGRESNQ